VIVSVKVLLGGLSPARFSVVLPEVVTVAGLKLAVIPEGTPVTVKLTVPVKPPVGVMVTV
jgi:hypothetical protein